MIEPINPDPNSLTSYCVRIELTGLVWWNCHLYLKHNYVTTLNIFVQEYQTQVISRKKHNLMIGHRIKEAHVSPLLVIGSKIKKLVLSLVQLHTTKGFFLWTPWLHSLVTVYLHLEINKRSSITLPPLDCISLLIYTMMMLVLSNSKCVLPAPQVSAQINKSLLQYTLHVQWG